jgi:hypothetical protein
LVSKSAQALCRNEVENGEQEQSKKDNKTKSKQKQTRKCLFNHKNTKQKQNQTTLGVAFAIWYLVDAESIESDHAKVIVYYSSPRLSAVLGMPAMLSGFMIFYKINLDIKQHSSTSIFLLFVCYNF